MRYSIIVALASLALVQAVPQATQISDGQVQAPTGSPTKSIAPVSQISDGQIQATTKATPVSQISDGQPQAHTSVATPVSQISDGQPQAHTSVAPPPPLSTAPTKVLPSGNQTVSTPTVAPFTGAGNRLGYSGLAVGAMAMAAFLM